MRLESLHRHRTFWVAYSLQAAAILVVVVPFCRQNNLLEWDFPGHYAAIWHLKTNLLPWPSGWNPLFYCGYPQGMFYPPLAHYITAILSLVIGIAPAMKALIALSLLSLPISFYAFARRWGLDDLQAAVSSTGMTSILFLSGQMLGTWSLGSDLQSILNVGLFANALSLPVLFGFLALCGGNKGAQNWKWAALLLGALFLLHPLSSLIAGIYVLSVALTRLQIRGPEPTKWRPLLLTVGVAFLIGAFWILPFTYFRGYMNPEFVPARWSPTIILIVLNGLILAVFSYSRPLLRPLIWTFVLLANFILIGTLWEMNLQFTRLTTYLLFFIPVFLTAWVQSRIIHGALIVLSVWIGLTGYTHSGLHPEGVPDFPLRNLGSVDGRILSVSPPSHLPSYHANHDPVAYRTGNISILGLFIESSLNGRFLANLTRILDPEAYIWGTPTEILRQEYLGKNYAEYVRDRMRLFDIRYVFTDLKLEETLDPDLRERKTFVCSYPIPAGLLDVDLEGIRRRYNTHGNLLDFYLYAIGKSSLIEPLPYLPGLPGSDWKLTNQKWFMGTRGVPIFTDRKPPLDARPAGSSDRVELTRVSPAMDRFVLQIHADRDIPVLLKVGYFPTWMVTVNGVKNPVFRASPNLILIFAHGQAIIEYERPWQEYLGLAATVAGIALLIFL